MSNDAQKYQVEYLWNEVAALRSALALIWADLD
jgi:hypothetical protein